MVASQHMPQSWGRNPTVEPGRVIPIYWRNDLPNLAAIEQTVLPYGYGRSYGDSCLNGGAVTLDVSHLNRFLAFDEEEGLLSCEAGVSLAEVLDLIVPKGWFIPVSPGTKFVSVGGAIANDVHGKNHHKAGTFGRHVTRFELLRSNGERLICSPTENSELYRATIGGLGLTGIILWAEFRLKAINGPFLMADHIRYSTLSEFMRLSEESDQGYEYTVAWIDSLAKGRQLGKGIFIRGNHEMSGLGVHKVKKPLLTVPFDAPSFMLNARTIKLLNEAYYRKQLQRYVHKSEHYEPFFYPLDGVHNWNRVYGKRGFYQYQFVTPFKDGEEVMREVLGRLSHSGEGSFVTVLKKFGDVPSPGLLSFPQPGLTLALDYPNSGPRLLRLFDELDELVRQSGGRVYPAKDARMSPESFQSYYPQWSEFARYIDPRFSSSFWRRVTQTVSEENREPETIAISQ